MKESDKTSSPSIYNTLLQLPLIKGVSPSRLTEMVGRLKIHFFKATDGESFVNAGSECKSLIFVLSGSVRLTMECGNGDFAISYTLEAPQVISPDCLFGIDTHYPCSVTAIGDTGLMEIRKEDFRQMMALDPVFLFNYLNSICTGSQRGRGGLASIAAGSATERLAYWITTLTQPGSRNIEITSRTRELHSIVGLTPTELAEAAGRLRNRVTMPDSHTLLVSSRDDLGSI